jgi:hypothetical protein
MQQQHAVASQPDTTVASRKVHQAAQVGFQRQGKGDIRVHGEIIDKLESSWIRVNPDGYFYTFPKS